MDRAIFFVDGSNWYHSLRAIGLDDLGRLDYVRVCRKLAGHRSWVGCRYYTAPVGPIGNPRMLADQRAFLSKLRAQDSQISIHYGRLEARRAEDETAWALRRYLSNLTIRIPTEIYKDLIAIGKTYGQAHVFVEKAVDVKLTVDMLTMAMAGNFETAYLLSADGDYTPLVQAIRDGGRKVFAVSAGPSVKLAEVANAYIRLRKEWFADCYKG